MVEVGIAVRPIVVAVITLVGVAVCSSARAQTKTSTSVRLAYGLGKGVTMSDDIGRFELNLRARVQTRYTAQAADDTRHGISIRRARLDVRGFVFSDAFRFRMQLAFSGEDLGLQEDGTARQGPVLDGYVDVRLHRTLQIRVGQNKVPFNLERQLSSLRSRLVDRSLVDEEFTLDRDVGVTLMSNDVLGCRCLGYALGIYNGEGRTPLSLETPAFLYLARLEVRPFGTIDHRETLDADRSIMPRIGLGGAIGYLDEAKRAQGDRGGLITTGATQDQLYWTGDLLVHWLGASLQVEAAGRRVVGGLGDRRTGYGIMAELGYVVPWMPLAVTGRYARVAPTGTGSALQRQQSVLVGLQYFIRRRAVRFVADAGRFWGPGFDQTYNQLRVQLEAAL